MWDKNCDSEFARTLAIRMSEFFIKASIEIIILINMFWNIINVFAIPWVRIIMLQGQLALFFLIFVRFKGKYVSGMAMGRPCWSIIDRFWRFLLFLFVSYIINIVIIRKLTLSLNGFLQLVPKKLQFWSAWLYGSSRGFKLDCIIWLTHIRVQNLVLGDYFRVLHLVLRWTVQLEPH